MDIACPEGAEEEGLRRGGRFLRPAGAGINLRIDFHGLRIGGLRRAAAPPVATPRGPDGAERHRAGDVHASAGEVPEGRQAPLASAHQHVQGGRHV
ncbi:MAG: hypothetical protein ACK54T_00955 [bacterium]